MSALASLYQAVFDTVKVDAEWGGRAYPDMIPAEVERPYVTWFWVAGGREYETPVEDAVITLTVKTVGNTLDEALSGAERIVELFANQGQQEAGTVVGDGEWEIVTIFQGRLVHLVERFSGAVPIYHSGHQFEFRMEKI